MILLLDLLNKGVFRLTVKGNYMKTLLEGLKRIASEHPETRKHLVPILREAMDFPSEKALKDYLKEHPDADKSKHHVKKQKGNEKLKSNLKDVLRTFPKELVAEVGPELRRLNRLLKGNPEFGDVSRVLIDVQTKLEDPWRDTSKTDPAEFYKRTPLNKAIADFAKAKYEELTGERW